MSLFNFVIPQIFKVWFHFAELDIFNELQLIEEIFSSKPPNIFFTERVNKIRTVRLIPIRREAAGRWRRLRPSPTDRREGDIRLSLGCRSGGHSLHHLHILLPPPHIVKI
jgi:hypothetical protein